MGNLAGNLDFLEFFLRQKEKKAKTKRDKKTFCGKAEEEYRSMGFITCITKFPLYGVQFVIGFDCTYIDSLPAHRMQPTFFLNGI